ncbi:hypothetical protein CFK37_02170 [Virgibacillus phasianinus]|uniref:Uncharacterized protein n=1 Tax=Virgibacillus phasianinus TaxID=2017483 RepID=A0A220TZI4_9BACI|nr:hypothetical protein [Virgibacillus phasianinus]ASK61086.1 hypothetical protein CFK37_02170 [Virgibacillus phasianinus]
MINANKYWKVVCRYGHVGKRKEITVSRYLETDNKCNLMDVLKIVAEMPGIKKRQTMMSSIVKAEPISKEQYTHGKEEEKQNFYLQRLRTYRQNGKNPMQNRAYP